MKKLLKLMAAIALVLAILPATAEDKALKPQETCPVMKGKINKALYADVKGKRIYVCCKGCIETIRKNPDKFLKKLEAMGEAAATLQTTCPVMGGKINKELYVDVEGKRIYICCKGCDETIKKDPEGHIKKIIDAGQVPYDIPPVEQPEKGKSK